MLRPAIFLALLPSLSWGQTPLPAYTTAQYEAAIIPFLVCLARHAAAIDTPQSAPATIAKSIEHTCPAQWPAVIRAQQAGLTPAQAADLAQFMETDPNAPYRFAIQAILAERKAAGQ